MTNDIALNHRLTHLDDGLEMIRLSVAEVCSALSAHERRSDRIVSLLEEQTRRVARIEAAVEDHAARLDRIEGVLESHERRLWQSPAAS